MTPSATLKRPKREVVEYESIKDIHFEPVQTAGMNAPALTGSSLRKGTVRQSNLDPNIDLGGGVAGWSSSILFAATNDTAVEWTSGSIYMPDGTTYAINAGSTGTMSGATYIYFDPTVSATALQLTGSAASSVGAERILIAVATPATSSGKGAEFQAFGGRGGIRKVVTADLIAANTITGNEIAANTINGSHLASTTIEVGRYIRSQSYVAGTSGWAIFADGTAEFQDVVVRGQITAEAGSVIDGSFLTAGSLIASKFAAGITPVEIVATLPATGNFEGRTAVLTTDGKVYRYHSGAWDSGIATSDLVGQIVTAQIADAQLTVAKFASGITPVEIVSSLPASGNFEGRTVYLTTDDKLYRYKGSAWGADVATSDLTGQIVGTQITDGAISSAKISANAVTANAISAGAVTAGKVAAGAISATEIASGAITTIKLAAGAVTANEIASNAITAIKINAGAIESDKLASNSVIAGKIAAGAINATNIIADGMVVSGKLAATAIDGMTITGALIRTSSGTSRVQLSDVANRMEIYISGSLYGYFGVTGSTDGAIMRIADAYSSSGATSVWFENSGTANTCWIKNTHATAANAALSLTHTGNNGTALKVSAFSVAIQVDDGGGIVNIKDVLRIPVGTNRYV